MADKDRRLEGVKQDVRSLLLTQQSGSAVGSLMNDYKAMLGQSLPFRAFGYSTPEDFLRSIPDVVSMQWSSRYNTYLLRAVSDESTRHIEKMVAKQKKSKTTSKRMTAVSSQTYNAPRFSRTYNSRNPVKPYLPASTRQEIFSVAKEFPNGISLGNFLLAFRKKFGRELVFQNFGFYTLQDCLTTVNEILLRTENEEVRVFPIIEHKNERTAASISTSLNSGNNRYVTANKENRPENNTSVNDKVVTKSPPERPPERTMDVLDEFVYHGDDEVGDDYGVDPGLRTLFQKIMKKNPQGIWVSQFPDTIFKLIGKKLDHKKLGYYNLVDLFNDLPEIFRIEVFDDCKDDWMLFDATIPVRVHTVKTKEEKTISSPHTKESPQSDLPSDVPSDAVVGCTEHRLQIISDDINMQEFFPVYLSAAYNPKLLYIQLHGPDTSHSLNQLMDDLDATYYSSESENYRMPEHYIMTGVICAAVWPDDGHWHRIRISSIPSNNFIVAFFMDYGTKERIPSNNLRFLKKRFMELPAQAIKSHLSGIKPIQDAWDQHARDCMLNIARGKTLMAHVVDKSQTQEGSLALILCDVSGEDDIYFNDLLVKQGFAKFLTSSQASSPEPLANSPQPRSASMTPPTTQQPAYEQPAPQMGSGLPENVSGNLLQMLFQAYSAPLKNYDLSNINNSNINFLRSLGPAVTHPLLLQQLQASGWDGNALNKLASPLQSSTQMPYHPQKTSHETHPTSNLTSTGFHSQVAPVGANHQVHGSDSEVFESDEEGDADDNPEVNSISKRYVKKVTLDDGYNHVYMIVIDDRPYMSSGDITYLLWNHDDPNYVRRKLKSKEISIPNITLNEVGNEQLFYQLGKFQVKGTKIDVSGNSHISLFPFKNVIDILNIFGHPSVAVRDIIDSELLHFDPSDRYWKTISEEEFVEDHNHESKNVDKNKERKGCLYELKASLQALKFRKQTLKNQLYSSASIPSLGDEIERIENQCMEVEGRIRELQMKVVSHQRERRCD